MNQELIVDEAHGVATVEQPQAPPANDLRHAMMTLPVAVQNNFLAQYKASRDNFREWLMSQLIEGVHYGIPPGCEPKTKEINGVMHIGVWNKKKDGGKGGFEWYPPSQWRAKPSLYAAGADFVCDIMGVRDEYETDLAAWQQMGSKPGNAVVKCRLISRATGEVIGESHGGYYHQYDPNNAMKMAAKCSKVGAVINAYDLRDLFTQDVAPQPNVNPDADESAPKEQTRAKREPKPDNKPRCADLLARWRSKHPQPDGDVAAWNQRYCEWARQVAQRDFKPMYSAGWTEGDFEAVESALEAMGV